MGLGAINLNLVLKRKNNIFILPGRKLFLASKLHPVALEVFLSALLQQLVFDDKQFEILAFIGEVAGNEFLYVPLLGCNDARVVAACTLLGYEHRVTLGLQLLEQGDGKLLFHIRENNQHDGIVGECFPQGIIGSSACLE